MKRTDPVYRKKVLIRKNVLKRLSQMDEAEILRASDKILTDLIETTWWKESSLILTYLSMKKEVATDRMIEAAHKAGKEVAVPCIDGKSMVFYTLNPAGQQYTFNWYGIREPERDGDPFQFANLSGAQILLVVPGLAYNRERFRLGRGAGYYDRFMHELRQAAGLTLMALGVFFHTQFEPTIPIDPWDERLDAILTERELLA
jgi:5-formyltetrahydrofolate cyclo-ligase